MTISSPTNPNNDVYEHPTDIVHLLNEVVHAATETQFYSNRLRGVTKISSLEDMKSIPVTSLKRLQRQSLSDTVTDESEVKWITGRIGGQSPEKIPVAEGYEKTSRRYEIFRDAIRGSVETTPISNSVVLTDPERRYFAAEIGTILGYTGIQAHVFIADGSTLPYKRIKQLSPDLLVVVSSNLEQSMLPSSLKLAVTFRNGHSILSVPQLDMYMVDELGFLAHSTNQETWVVYNDEYYFEISSCGTLIVSSLRDHVQPLLRIDTGDSITQLGKYHMTLGNLYD